MGPRATPLALSAAATTFLVVCGVPWELTLGFAVTLESVKGTVVVTRIFPNYGRLEVHCKCIDPTHAPCVAPRIWFVDRVVELSPSSMKRARALSLLSAQTE